MAPIAKGPRIKLPGATALVVVFAGVNVGVINVNSVPLVIFLVAEAASWVFLLVRWLIVRPRFSRPRAVIGVVFGAALIQVLGLVRGLPERTVALLGTTAALSFEVSTLVLRRHYARYFEAQEEHGVRSVQSRKASNPVAFGIVGLVVVFAAIFRRPVFATYGCVLT